ncbi:triose-phosphate isomerase [Citroniella saccharovorans]|uniref:Triosephosphate isomerase n=1 Tax=Citroniella saccharovorans TaxID=2053367 RepID=A0AAW9MQR4_9FIRM|nr:triose-phosphate isomerase [Citroniella saccharovorans]MEB3429426.1 triose-phosphate isomerase [Citroniella saccharovorans]
MERRPIIAGNWKMNLTNSESIKFLDQIFQMSLSDNVEKIIYAPSLFLKDMIEKVTTSGIIVGAENCYYEDKGAYTGEISPLMLKDIDCLDCLIGHSERREIFKEDDRLINKKIKALIKHGIRPLLCVGESSSEKDAGLTKDKVKVQIESAFEGLSRDDLKDIIIAYEPIWAIGTGITPTSSEAEETIKYIRDVIRGIHGDLADSIRILYGGSVKPDNIESFMAEENIDGALVGGASLNPTSYSALVNY